jgi:uncharacterized integral membrane protein
LTDTSPSVGRTLRRIAAALILVLLAIIIIAFAVANWGNVTVSFDPFSSSTPAAVVTTHLFLVILAALVLGVIVGGIASWIGQAKWRRAARRLERDLSALRTENDALKRAATPPGIARIADRMAEPPERVKLRAPIR